jgi:GGDEF domain-containing protein
MPLQGSLVVISQAQMPELAAAITKAGAFPLIETTPADAAAAIAAAHPEAIVLADPYSAEDAALAQDLAREITAAAPIIPVIARVRDDGRPAYREALPVRERSGPGATVLAVSAALRARTLHGSVLRRAELVRGDGLTLPVPPKNDPLEDAIVVVTGRGRSYPDLTLAVGESSGLIGALSVETAARYLKDRDVDGLVIGDGFSHTAVDGLLTVLSEDNRFRDLPIGVLMRPGMHLDYELQMIAATDAQTLVAHLLPYVRLHAFEARLKRIMQSLDAEGMIDPDTGLLRPEHFTRELDRAIHSARERGVGLSVARFAFADDLDHRGNMDAARLVSRLVRGGDFGCRQEDGSILVTFAETDQRDAHVVARRLANVLKHTMLSSGQRQPAAPRVTLAARKSSDDISSLLARVLAPQIAAE